MMRTKRERARERKKAENLFQRIKNNSQKNPTVLFFSFVCSALLCDAQKQNNNKQLNVCFVNIERNLIRSLTRSFAPNRKIASLTSLFIN